MLEMWTVTYESSPTWCCCILCWVFAPWVSAQLKMILWRPRWGLSSAPLEPQPKVVITFHGRCVFLSSSLSSSPSILLSLLSLSLGKPSLKKKKKSVTFFTLGSDPPPLFCVKCDEKLIYFLSIIRAYLGHIEPIKIFYPQNHLKKYEKSAKI